MQLTICGVRGSTPAPGPEFVRYGGNTSCIAVGSRGEIPTLILDAGTGLTRLSRILNRESFRGTILLGHLHWDHTHGLPFFPAGDRPDARTNILMPAQGDPEQLMLRIMSPPHFPITLDELRGEWTVSSIEEGQHTIEGFNVLAREIPHKGSRTFGYRISDGEGTFAYMSDHSPIVEGEGPDGLGEYHPVALELASGVDLLIHDCQYTAEEFPARASWGHSAIEYAVGLARKAGARKLMMFHHDPSRTDGELDRFCRAYGRMGVDVDVAREGTVIDL
ncbi:MAG: MBL fold metallo-hydrolase [Actinomycetota bacterium]